MSHSLVKLVDLALLPAALMVVGKLVGLVFVINVFKLPWTLRDLSSSVFNVRPAFLSEDILTASTYSDLVMYLVMAIAFSLVLSQATHFHDTHIKPSLLVRLSNNNLIGLVRGSFDIYHTAAIWLLFIWLAGGVIWLNVIMAKTELWLGLISLVANVVFTTLLLQDVYKEIELGRKNLGRQNALT